jgi:hypothetical protein
MSRGTKRVSIDPISEIRARARASDSEIRPAEYSVQELQQAYDKENEDMWRIHEDSDVDPADPTRLRELCDEVANYKQLPAAGSRSLQQIIALSEQVTALDQAMEKQRPYDVEQQIAKDCPSMAGGLWLDLLQESGQHALLIQVLLRNEPSLRDQLLAASRSSDLSLVGASHTRNIKSALEWKTSILFGAKHFFGEKFEPEKCRLTLMFLVADDLFLYLVTRPVDREVLVAALKTEEEREEEEKEGQRRPENCAYDSVPLVYVTHYYAPSERACLRVATKTCIGEYQHQHH